MQQFTTTFTRPVLGLTFGPGGRFVFAGGSGGYDTWELPTGKHFHQASHATKYYYGCQADPHGNCIYVSDSVKGLRLLSPWTDKAGTTPGSVHEQHVISFDVTRDGKQLLVSRGGATTNRQECWNVRPDGSLVAAWSLLDGKPVSTEQPYLINDGQWFTYAVAWGNGDTQCVTNENRTSPHSKPAERHLLVIRAAADGSVVNELGHVQDDDNVKLQFAQDGRTVIAWSCKRLERWDVAAAQATHTVPTPGRGEFNFALLHPTQPVLLTASGDGQLRVWSSVDLQLIKSHKLGLGKLHSLALSPDGKQIAAGGNKGEVVLYQLHAAIGEIS